MNQLFYSPDTRINVEHELCKRSNEPNPFRTGHWFNWGQHREIAETIGEMMKRWNETLEDSKLVKYLFGYYKSEFLSEMENVSNKKLYIEEEIPLYSNRKLNDNELPMKSDIGYKNKGYRWFELGKNFSLKDFITYHPETSNVQVYHRPEYINYHCFVSIETLAEQAPLNEVNFLYACEGYAAAKYVSFLKDQLSVRKNKVNNSKIFTDSLDYIDEALIVPFLEKEKVVTDEQGRWNDSAIRLASFCELLYEKRYFTIKPGPQKRPVSFINDFAKSRYGIDIDGALQKAKEAERIGHKNQVKNSKAPLKNLFK